MNNNVKMLIVFMLAVLLFGYYAFMMPKPQQIQTALEPAPDTSGQEMTDNTVKETFSEGFKPDAMISADTTSYEFETDLLKGALATYGSSFISISPIKFDKKDKSGINLVPEGGSLLGAVIKSGSRTIDTRGVNFSLIYKGDIFPLSSDEDSIVLLAKVDSFSVRRTFVFRKGVYTVEQRITSNVQIDNVIYSFDEGISLTEPNIQDDMQYYAACAFSTGNFTRTKSKAVKDTTSFSGDYGWTGLQTKYFFAGIIGKGKTMKLFPVQDKRIGAEFTFTDGDISIYAGPIDYKILKSYNNGMDRLPDFGWSLIQPISKFILVFMQFVYRIIPNYGVIIILISIIFILLFSPLTFTSYKSMSKMQMIQPQIEELKKKHAKDPQRLNDETMKLYKRVGFNPFTGCLPMFIQMPIFFALYAILRTTIELRHAPFAFWIVDLAAKDPYYVLPIVTGLAMFVSQKISLTDNSQKMLVYTMPIMITFMFLNLPAGINLYWFTYNLLSIGQQLIIKRLIKKQQGVLNGSAE